MLPSCHSQFPSPLSASQLPATESDVLHPLGLIYITCCSRVSSWRRGALLNTELSNFCSALRLSLFGVNPCSQQAQHRDDDKARNYSKERGASKWRISFEKIKSCLLIWQLRGGRSPPSLLRARDLQLILSTSWWRSNSRLSKQQGISNAENVRESQSE